MQLQVGTACRAPSLWCESSKMASPNVCMELLFDRGRSLRCPVIMLVVSIGAM